MSPPKNNHPLKSLPPSSYQVWTADKLIPTSIVHKFRSNVIDFDSQPRCWAGTAFDYVHYSVPRNGLDDIAEDLGFGRVRDYRLAVLEDDLVVAQITKSILPFLGRASMAVGGFSGFLAAQLHFLRSFKARRMLYRFVDNHPEYQPAFSRARATKI